jgi:hypothetical protein
LQAKSELTFVVCANVFGLSWSQQLLAMMESARFLPYKPYGLEGPLPIPGLESAGSTVCAISVIRQQTWQELNHPS